MLLKQVKKLPSSISTKLLILLFVGATVIIFHVYSQKWIPSTIYSIKRAVLLKIDLTRKKLDSVPIILTWTPYFTADLARYLAQTIANSSYKCFVTSNRSYLESANAVVFHIRNLNISDLPVTRRVDQYFVFFLLESPYHTGGALGRTLENSIIPDDYFNLTMTYRQNFILHFDKKKDGDVLAGYGKLDKIDPEDPGNITVKFEKIRESFLGRKKAVLQFVSHCNTPSQREIYTNELKRYIKVTQIGSCGIRNCSKTCEEKAIAEHNFYLSFENSICKDYVTEKLYLWLEKFLPIVLKRSTYRGIIPNDAFIAVDDFRSPKDLANYLNYLLNNRTAFMQYFEWVKMYKKAEATPGCDLCKLLHEKRSSTPVIRNVRRWWYNDAHCIPSYVTKLFARNNYTLFS